MSTPFPANLGDLQTATSTLLNDPTNTRYSLTLINQFLDLAQDRWNREAYICRLTRTIAVTAGQSVYGISGAGEYIEDTPLAFMRITHKGIALIKRSKEYFDQYSGIDWTTTTGTPTQYVIDLNSAPASLILYPVPQSNDAGSNLKIEYCIRHVQMVNSTDVPFTANASGGLTTNTNYMILPYAAGLAYEAAASILEGDPTAETVKKAASFRIYANQILSQVVQWYDRLDADEPMRFMGGRNWHR